MRRDNGTLLLFKVEPKIKIQASAMLNKQGDKKSNFTPQLRFIVSYEITLHYSNTYVPQNPIEVGVAEVNINEVLSLVEQLGIKAKKSTIYGITERRKWKLSSTAVPNEIQEAVKKHLEEHNVTDEEVKALPVKFTIKRKTANNATPGNN